MKNTNKQNPLKTFNDSYDKKVDSFNKNLKKFQGDIGGSQVGKSISPQDNTKVFKNLNVPSLSSMKKNKKELSDLKRPYTSIAIPDRESSFPGDSVRYYPGQRGSLGVPYIRDLGRLRGLASDSDEDFLKLSKSPSAKVSQDTATVKANPSFMANQKKGGVVKTKKK